MFMDEEHRNLDYHFLLWQFKFDHLISPKELGLDRIEAKKQRKPVELEDGEESEESESGVAGKRAE